MYEEEKKFIKDVLDTEDYLCGLAEEASELSQAALKFRRASGYGLNRTPITMEQANKNIEEEIIDVLMYLMVGYNENEIYGFMYKASTNPKWTRWADRIAEARNI